MFNCPSCLVSCLRAVAPDLGASLPRVRRPSTQTLLDSPRWQRNYATAAHAGVRRKGRGQKLARYLPEAERNVASASPKPEPPALEPVLPAELSYKPRHLHKELERLTDPLRLAQNTQRLLAEDKEEKALELVKLAGNTMSYVVSWNHLLDYNLGRGNVQRAWKLFNEMKKRGQRPDAYTFTTLLDGLAENADSRLAMEKAEAVYNSMYAPNSPVRPNTTHMNAMLKVCSRAHNLDKMFEIAAQMPTSGRSAPTSATYVTILNALRASVEKVSHAENAEHQQNKREQAISQAKRMWADIVEAWQSGSLQMDDKLVCAMGRVLLMSSDDAKPDPRTKENADAVFALVAQAMGIPRQAPTRIRDPRTQQRLQSKNLVGDLVDEEKVEDASLEGSGAVSPDDAGLLRQLDQGSIGGDVDLAQLRHRPDLRGSVFEELPLKDGQMRQYARPSRDAVSMIMTACLHLRAFREGTAYWSLLQQTVEPDQENCLSYLRLLRIQRASSQAVELIDKMINSKERGGYGSGAQKKTFVVAMSVCARDINNPNMLGNATLIMQQMHDALPWPSVKVMERFDELLKLKHKGLDINTTLSCTAALSRVMEKQQSTFEQGQLPKHRQYRDTKPVKQTRTTKLPGHFEIENHNLMKMEVLQSSKIVESSIMRTMDFYREGMPSELYQYWNKKLKSIRRWRYKLYGNEPGKEPLSPTTSEEAV